MPSSKSTIGMIHHSKRHKLLFHIISWWHFDNYWIPRFPFSGWFCFLTGICVCWRNYRPQGRCTSLGKITAAHQWALFSSVHNHRIGTVSLTWAVKPLCGMDWTTVEHEIMAVVTGLKTSSTRQNHRIAKYVATVNIIQHCTNLLLITNFYFNMSKAQGINRLHNTIKIIVIIIIILISLHNNHYHPCNCHYRHHHHCNHDHLHHSAM